MVSHTVRCDTAPSDLVPCNCPSTRRNRHGGASERIVGAHHDEHSPLVNSVVYKWCTLMFKVVILTCFTA